jgi:hypothetical protein
VRRLVVDATLSAGALLDAFQGSEPLDLTLESPPPLARGELLAAAARSDALFVTRFSGALATPLAELALLSLASEWAEGGSLDLTGALLTPLVRRTGLAQARRLLAKGPLVAAEDVLAPWRGAAGRSAAAVRLVRGLLASPCGPAQLLALERAAFQLVMTLPDRAEGIRAFRERRAPRFDW